MDSLTQAALGAALGEATLGRRVGAKAALWGAAFGTLPDLDVVAAPFVDTAAWLAIHRGFTHALLFAPVVAPFAGLALSRLHRSDEVPWTGWAWLVFLALFTHPILDAFTVYGTQLLLPFSDRPVSLPSLFIIDPLYTVPLLTGVVAALFLKRDSRLRRRVNTAGLVLSTLYVAWSLVGRHTATRAFEQALAAEQIPAERLLVAPMPFSTLLWSGLAETEEGYRVALFSLLDEAPPVAFRTVPRRGDLLDPVRGTREVDRLLWFSRGWYQMERRGDDLLFHDLRFGRSDGWLTDDGSYIFTFVLDRPPGTPDSLLAMDQAPQSFDLPEGAAQRLLDRILSRP